MATYPLRRTFLFTYNNRRKTSFAENVQIIYEWLWKPSTNIQIIEHVKFRNGLELRTPNNIPRNALQLVNIVPVFVNSWVEHNVREQRVKGAKTPPSSRGI